jgi:hypothetical protein
MPNAQPRAVPRLHPLHHDLGELVGQPDHVLAHRNTARFWVRSTDSSTMISRRATRPAARMSPAAATKKPSIIVRFLINSQGIAGFEGQVQVISNTAQPIAGWQIVVALPEDGVVTVTNASGFVSNGILVLQPAFGAPRRYQPGAACSTSSSSP